MAQAIEEIRKLRIEKLEKLKKLGINPYPAKFSKPFISISSASQKMGEDVSVVGRLWSIREHGEIIFADLRDQSGKIQLLVRSKGEIFSLFDSGDFIGVTGKVIKTNSGEITVEVIDFEFLGKSLRPMPSSWDGLKDTEIRYRRRYLDMNVNPQVRERFVRRAKFWEAHREFFKAKGFVEINIPVLEHIPGGGDAKPFVTHMDAIDEDFYLRISQELYLKRLIGGGFEKVYEIGPRFRNEGLSDEHLPEHMAMEFYWAYADWKDGMEFIEELYKYIIEYVYPDKKLFKIRGFDVDFSKKWEIIDFSEILKKHYGVDVLNPDLEKLKEIILKNKIKFSGTLNIPRAVDTLWKEIRKTIAGPAFLINHPKYLSPLQKPSLENPNIVERFQPIIAGSELGNGWSEVNDPLDQFERFSQQQKLRDSGDQEAQWLDVDYVEMLEYGMPPAFGYGHAERTFWFLEDVTAREGVPFPQLRFEIDPISKKIYGLSDSKTTSRENLPDEQEKRFIAVLKKDVEPGRLMNALGHMTAGLAGGYGKAEEMCFLQYEDKDGGKHPNISHYPFIVLRADNSNQIRTIREEAIKRGFLYTDFTSTMTVGTSGEQVKATKETLEKDLDYFGICLFGKTSELKEFTGKFSLFK